MTNQYDLLIVGCGAAGLAAAVTYIESQQQSGAAVKLAILEAAPAAERGGATRWTTSRFRALEDYRLDPLFVGKVQEVSGGLADADYCRAFEAEARDSLLFIERHGVQLNHFNPILAMGVEHEIVPNGGGHAIVETLAGIVEKTPGAEFFYRMEALRLTTAEDGRVTGVVARGGDGLLQTLRAQNVLLACGGFEGNAEMLTRYLGNNACDLKLLAPGLRFNTGAGIRMATEIGAATSGQFDMIHSELVDRRTDRADAVILAHPYGILVNGEGRRFFDEGQGTFEETFELAAFEVWKNQKQTAFFIFDQTIRSHPIIPFLCDTDQPPVEADTVEGLAAQLGLEPDALAGTVREFNAACGAAPFDPTIRDGKATSGLTPEKSNWANPIDTAPFYAYPLTTAVCFTYGGLRTDTAARVVSATGVPIPGLFAAGEITGVFYHEYPPGTSVFRSLTFGRIAGRQAAMAAVRESALA
jgi:tricarballylate dehydrogenase